MSKKKLNVITSNQGKYREYEKLLSEFTKVKMLDIGYPEIQAEKLEDVVKFALNQLENYAPLIIDDSGLFIEQLGGFPGVYSSYVMKTLGCEGIIRLLEGTENRNARFECVIGYTGNKKKIFKGISKGEITKNKRGKRGFGYDPIFKPLGKNKTFAEMTIEEKNKISHRGKSMRSLVDFIKEEI
ncbi:MAG: XTP/dITP diphosphatase [Thermoplasmatota archaeon]